MEVNNEKEREKHTKKITKNHFKVLLSILEGILAERERERNLNRRMHSELSKVCENDIVVRLWIVRLILNILSLGIRQNPTIITKLGNFVDLSIR